VREWGDEQTSDEAEGSARVERAGAATSGDGQAELLKQPVPQLRLEHASGLQREVAFGSQDQGHTSDIRRRDDCVKIGPNVHRARRRGECLDQDREVDLTDQCRPIRKLRDRITGF
jgi:hypothetical protein